MLNLIRPRVSAWPSSLILNPQLLLALPEYAQTWDYGRISPSSAVGSVGESIRGAVGEFLERKHFYNEIIPTSTSRLDESMSHAETQSFIKALLQTSKKSRDEILCHKFQTSQVFNLFTLEKRSVPTVFISLSNHDLKEDFLYLSNRDTTGCAAHVDLEKSISSSVNELIERQCLLSYWLTGEANYAIAYDDFSSSSINTLTKSLINKFIGSGDVEIYDISIPSMPGYAVLSIYGSKDDDARVKYSAGLSYSLSAKNALEKSILELWQCFVYLHYFDVSEYKITEVDDPYHKHFWDSNDYSTFSSFSSFHCVNSTDIGSYVSQNSIHKSTVNSRLEELTSSVYLYLNSEKVRGKTIWYTKAFSPDFFLHMDFSSPVNHDNVVSDMFGQVIPERKAKMVPFP